VQAGRNAGQLVPTSQFVIGSFGRTCLHQYSFNPGPVGGFFIRGDTIVSNPNPNAKTPFRTLLERYQPAFRSGYSLVLKKMRLPRAREESSTYFAILFSEQSDGCITR
jgi:hypothetical protein